MNKAGTKLSKLNRFLFSEDVLDMLPNYRVTTLNRLWSDRNPILFHCHKSDFGPTPFKIYHSWFLHPYFDDLIKLELANLDQNSDGSKVMFHDKLKRLKLKIKQWHMQLKNCEHLRKQGLAIHLKEI